MGNHHWEGHLDLLNVVMIGLAKTLPEKEYDIALEDSVRREMDQMCNLGEGIWEEAYETATVEYIMNMHKKNYTVEQIADVTDKPIAEIEDIIRKEDMVSV